MNNSHELVRLLGVGMSRVFDSSAVGQESGRIHFVVLTSAGPCDLWLEVSSAGCFVAESGVRADVTIELALPVLIALALKQTNGADAYRAGDLSLDGDVGLAVGIDQWFGPIDSVALSEFADGAR